MNKQTYAKDIWQGFVLNYDDTDKYIKKSIIKKTTK